MGVDTNFPRPVVLTDSKTFTWRELLETPVIVQTGSAKTITLPTPQKERTNETFFVLNTGSGACTISATLASGSSHVLDTKSCVLLRVLPTAASTYKWTVFGIGPALTGLSETIADVVGAMVTGNTETNITVSYQDTDNTLDFVLGDHGHLGVAGDGGVITMASISDWAPPIDYVRTGLTGGTANDLDGISGAALTDGKRALVVVGNNPAVLYNYVLDADNNGAESSPDIITPDTSPGTKRWVLATMSGYSTVYGTEPAAVSSSTSGTAGVAESASRSDHGHDLSPHTHVDNTNGGAVAHTALTSLPGSADGVHLSNAEYADLVTNRAETVQDIAGAMVTGNTETGISVTYQDDDGTLDFVVALADTEPPAVSSSTSGAVGDSGNVARQNHCHDLGAHVHEAAASGGQLSTASLSDYTGWAVFVPDTITWAVATPTIDTAVYRMRVVGKTVQARGYVVMTDGKDTTGCTIKFPAGMVPSDVDMIVIGKCVYTIAAGAYTAGMATLDANDGTAGNRILTLTTAAITNGGAGKLLFDVTYEIP